MVKPTVKPSTLAATSPPSPPRRGPAASPARHAPRPGTRGSVSRPTSRPPSSSPSCGPRCMPTSPPRPPSPSTGCARPAATPRRADMPRRWGQPGAQRRMELAVLPLPQAGRVGAGRGGPDGQQRRPGPPHRAGRPSGRCGAVALPVVGRVRHVLVRAHLAAQPRYAVMPALLWFRRDLRLGDHPALAEAVGRPTTRTCSPASCWIRAWRKRRARGGCNSWAMRCGNWTTTSTGGYWWSAAGPNSGSRCWPSRSTPRRCTSRRISRPSASAATSGCARSWARFR